MDSCLPDHYVTDIIMVTMDFWYERTVSNCKTNGTDYSLIRAMLLNLIYPRYTD